MSEPRAGGGTARWVCSGVEERDGRPEVRRQSHPVEPQHRPPQHGGVLPAPECKRFQKKSVEYSSPHWARSPEVGRTKAPTKRIIQGHTVLVRHETGLAECETEVT
ncbi:hypothetical protein NDU88_004269 [Pleurodeles waltl]|uniref:Uncharacterized protein n=1 Tax=Pleurodeles waltl TaxID=8319 RepID=A0AAV7NM76_PLEWA|nr:hypothetical protein NDU88_004269 [Pleurodeles waltl]